MLEHVEKLPHARSRIGHVGGAVIRPWTKNSRRAAYRHQWYVLLGIGLATVGYLLVGKVVQYADPQSGWLDVGTLSLPLFAAWSCLLGYGVAGLLPVLLHRIGRKGGIKEWQSKIQQIGVLVVYIGYVILLCVLL